MRMQRRMVSPFALLVALVCVLFSMPGSAMGQSDGAAPDVAGDGIVSGTIIHVLESPAEVAGNPSLASISNAGMSCSVSFGNNLGGPDNFSMVVYSEEVGDTLVVGRMAVQWGKARSITLENGEILEAALYDYVVLVVDGVSQESDDTWSMTLWGAELMFDGVTFSGPVTAGDLIVQP